MPKLIANGIELAYEQYGDKTAPDMLLIQGLSMPSAAWPEPMIDGLVGRGFRVTIFDNRDVGYSQKLDELKMPNVLWQSIRQRLRLPVSAPYALTDMANDAKALMDALDIETAHVVGISMGGMISQILATGAPDRLQSLVSIMSTTNDRKLPGPQPAVVKLILKGPASAEKEDVLVHLRQLWRMLGGPEHPKTDDEMNAFLNRAFANGMHAAGSARQTVAILSTKSRVQALQSLSVPTLVIHGDRDPLVPVECGIATAKAIPGAKLELIAGMGHDLPTVLNDTLVGMIATHARSNHAVSTAVR